MTKRQWLGISIGVGVFLTAFLVALAVTIIQVSRQVPSTLRLGVAVVISGDNLGLWHDEEKTLPVTWLDFNVSYYSHLSTISLFPQTVYMPTYSSRTGRI